MSRVAQPSTPHQGRWFAHSTRPQAQVCQRGFATPRHLRGFATPRHLRASARVRRGAQVFVLPRRCLGAQQSTGALSHSECSVVFAASALLGPSAVSSAEAFASGCALSKTWLC
jgi:hypothetical protein